MARYLTDDPIYVEGGGNPRTLCRWPDNLTLPRLRDVNPAEAGLPVVEIIGILKEYGRGFGRRPVPQGWCPRRLALALPKSGCTSCPGPLDGPEQTSIRIRSRMKVRNRLYGRLYRQIGQPA